MPEHDYSHDSILALGRIPADSDENRVALEAACRNWIETIERGKWPRALQYFENASYLCGNHLTRFYYTSDLGFGFHQFGVNDQSKFDSIIAKSVDNRLIRPTETVVSMLTGPRPIPRVQPNSENPEDEDAAALSEFVVQLSFEKTLDMPTREEEAAMMGLIFGRAAIEIEFGPTSAVTTIPKFRTERRRVSVLDEEESEVAVPAGEETAYREDLTARTWTPLHLSPDPAATDPSNAAWFIRSSFEDIDWIRESFDRDEEGYFPEALDGIQLESVTRYSLYWWHRLQDILESPQYFMYGMGLAASGRPDDRRPNTTLFSVIDVRPSLEFPRGRTLVMAGPRLIYAGENRAWHEKYQWRWHKYGFWWWFKIPGKFEGVPLLSETVPIQKRINAIDALVQANRQYLSIGQWLLPKHSKVAEGKISGFPGEHYTYTAVPGLPGPEKIENVGLPEQLLVERQLLVQAIDHIAATGAIGGENVSPSAARAGAIFNFLREERLRAKSPMIRSFERMLEVCGQNVLIEYQTNLGDATAQLNEELATQLQQLAREHSSLAVAAFTGASLRDHHSVLIDIASELHYTAEAKRAAAIEYMQAQGGALTPAEREGFQRALGLDEFVKNAQSASVQRARRMISRIISGQIEYVFPIPGVDDPAAMAPEFQRALLSDRVHDLSLEQKKKLFELFDYYRAEAAKQQENAMRLQLAMAAAAEASAKPAGSQARPAGGGGETTA